MLTAYDVHMMVMKCFIDLFRAETIDYGHAFNLTMYLENETDYIVWKRVDSSIAYVQKMLFGKAELYSKFQVRAILSHSQVMPNEY